MMYAWVSVEMFVIGDSANTKKCRAMVSFWAKIKVRVRTHISLSVPCVSYMLVSYVSFNIPLAALNSDNICLLLFYRILQVLQVRKT